MYTHTEVMNLDSLEMTTTQIRANPTWYCSWATARFLILPAQITDHLQLLEQRTSSSCFKTPNEILLISWHFQNQRKIFFSLGVKVSSDVWQLEIMKTGKIDFSTLQIFANNYRCDNQEQYQEYWEWEQPLLGTSWGWVSLFLGFKLSRTAR